MGLFGQSSPFDADIEKATSDTKTNEDWTLILNVCDKINANPRNAKEGLKAIMKRMGDDDPHVVMQTITLLDACVNNCGKQFHLEIASREFEKEFRRLLKSAQPKIKTKMCQMLKNWAEHDFKTDPQLNLIPSLYSALDHAGFDFSQPSENPVKSAAKEAAVSSQQEQDDIAKAIELSLKEAKNSPKKQHHSSASSSTVASAATTATAAYPSLYPSVTGNNKNGNAAAAASATGSAPAQPEPRKVRALYDFEAAEENELTFIAGDIIHVTDDTDRNWWKGYNQRGDGLFPSNFVSSDLSVDPEMLDANQHNKSANKSLQFEEDAKELQQKTEAAVAAAAAASQAIEIDETKIDRLLHLLHEANPEDPSQDTEEMLRLEQEVHQMGPLIDAELERVDRKHAQLTQLSVDLVDAMNLYHTLMRDDRAAAAAMMGGAGFMGAAGMGGGGSGAPGLPLGMAGGYQQTPPHMLYSGAGYVPAGQLGQQYMTSTAAGFGDVTQAAQHNPQVPQPQQQQMIPMQYQNGRVHSPLMNGALTQNIASPLPTHLYGTQQQQTPPTSTQIPPQQQHNYQLLAQQQQFQLQTNTDPQLQQQQQQHQQHLANPQQQQQYMPSPQQQQQQTQQQQPDAAYMQAAQQHFYTMTNGPTAYMPPHGNMLPPTNNTTQQQQQQQQQLPPQQQQQPPSNNDYSQLQQHMAAMSLAAAAGIQQPVTQNFLVQNEPKNNIPIYQQQR